MVLATIMTVLASPVAYCNWTNNDPAAVVQECTAQLLAQTPEPWMYFNRGLALQDARTARRGVPRLFEGYCTQSDVRRSVHKSWKCPGPPSHLTQAMR